MVIGATKFAPNDRTAGTSTSWRAPKGPTTTFYPFGYGTLKIKREFLFIYKLILERKSVNIENTELEDSKVIF